MICFYHSRDLDGWCSAAIVKKAFPQVELVGYDYGEPFPWSKIVGHDKIIMVDVSLPMKEMEDLASTGNFTWIDHHISAIEAFNKSTSKTLKTTMGRLDTNFAACELTWKYFYPAIITPEIVTILGKYDTFRKDDGDWDSVLNFQYGMRLYCNSPETFFNGMLEPTTEANEVSFASFFSEIIADGKTVLRYQKQLNEFNAKRAFEIYFGSLIGIPFIDRSQYPKNNPKIIALNTDTFGTQAFDSIYDPDKHDMMMPFRYDGKNNKWICSLYTTKDEVDCSYYANLLGGGGHKKASGFELKSISHII